MDKKLFLNIVWLLFTSSIFGAMENPNVGDPFSKKNAPSGSVQRQRFITGGNTYGKSGNDIVTGNVGGGKHFRGVVPYGSSYYSDAYSRSPGSGVVNDFVRRSSNPIANDRNPGRTQTYYDPRRSVSSMERPDGTSGLPNPQLAGQAQKNNPDIVPNATTRSLLTTPEYQRPLSTNNMDLELFLSQRQEQKEDAEKNVAQSEKKSDEKGFFDEPLSPDLIKQNQKDKQEQESEETPPPHENILNRLQKENQDAVAEQLPDEVTESKEKSNTQTASRTNPLDIFTPKADVDELSKEGRKALGINNTYGSFADEKFAGYMDAAETFIKNGKFYKAADAYALAAVWKPQDARVYLGQSFSLFAAGEYMSSAYHLSHAFELNPHAAMKKYNLSEFINNRDVFENSVLEMETWQQRSESGELAFLLAYISYQDGKTTRATEQIRKAQEAMPDSPAVTVLKNVIAPEVSK